MFRTPRALPSATTRGLRPAAAHPDGGVGGGEPAGGLARGGDGDRGACPCRLDTPGGLGSGACTPAHGGTPAPSRAVSTAGEGARPVEASPALGCRAPAASQVTADGGGRVPGPTGGSTGRGFVEAPCRSARRRSPRARDHAGAWNLLRRAGARARSGCSPSARGAAARSARAREHPGARGSATAAAGHAHRRRERVARTAHRNTCSGSRGCADRRHDTRRRPVPVGDVRTRPGHGADPRHDSRRWFGSDADARCRSGRGKHRRGKHRRGPTRQRCPSDRDPRPRLGHGTDPRHDSRR